MEVSVGGVAVSNGSTLSATGQMLVTCNVPYQLTVDNVPWVPISSNGSVDTYVLSSSGVVRIIIGGSRYFYFTNTITPDFEYERNTVYISTGGGLVGPISELHNYVQTSFVEGTTSCRCVCIVDPAIRDSVLALGATSSQGNATIGLSTSQNIQVVVDTLDITQYCAVYIGNVLIAFFEPVV